MKDGTPVRVLGDAADVARTAADLVLMKAARAKDSGRLFSMAISGGSTPRALYSLFAGPPWMQSLPWQIMHLFWADERCVPPDHDDSNYRLAQVAFLSRVPVPPANVHRIHGEEGPDRAASLYTDELERFFGNRPARFDLVILGVGEDGHTASLFPGAAGIRESKDAVLPVHRTGPGWSRVTLSLRVLNGAAQVLFLATGRPKAAVVRAIIEEGNPHEYPAGLVRPVNGELLWLVDREAGTGLKA